MATASKPPSDETSQLYEILARANQIASNTELDDLLDQMLDLIIEVCGGNAGTLYLLDSEKDELIFKVIRGSNSDHNLVGRRIKTNAGIAGATMSQHEPLVIEDLAHDPRWQKVSRSSEGLRNVISTPLLLRGKPIGVVQVFNYSHTPLQIVQMLGARMASEIEKAILLDASQQRNTRLEALIDIIGIIGSNLDRDLVLHLIVRYARNLLHAEHASLFLIDEEQNDIVLHISSSESKVPTLRVPRGQGIIGAAIESGDIIFVPNVHEDDRHFKDAEPITGITTTSLIAVPLITQAVQLGQELGSAQPTIIGGLEAINRVEGYFTTEDAELLQTLAKQAATVFQIAKLYGDANELFLDTIQAMVASIDAKDPYTNGHSQRVSDFSVAIGKQMNLPPEIIHRLRIGALLHDIGKIGIPDTILSKPGHLTEDEISKMKQHPAIGANIMKNVRLLRDEIPALAEHHEHIDGTGYPNNLRGDQISLFGRIVAAADVFDALTSDRPYRAALDVEEVLNRMQKDSGSHFDDVCVQALIKAYLAGEIKTQKDRAASTNL
ncbi:MAG: phosphohydrolase [Anaerolineae bacterium]|nr:MAG: phosphohydrolase [Anaerolineae bacterium]WKZ45744.1 MAG: GAF domain-containing protein [Anaerolineales bacterium]